MDEKQLLPQPDGYQNSSGNTTYPPFIEWFINLLNEHGVPMKIQFCIETLGANANLIISVTTMDGDFHTVQSNNVDFKFGQILHRCLLDVGFDHIERFDGMKGGYYQQSHQSKRRYIFLEPSENVDALVLAQHIQMICQYEVEHGS